MSDLATLAIDAHGGLERWRRLKTVSARLVQGGVLWQLKGQNGVLDDVHVTVDLRKEWASHRPFGQPDRRSSFQPDRVAIETSNGDVVEERANPRESFKVTSSTLVGQPATGVLRGLRDVDLHEYAVSLRNAWREDAKNWNRGRKTVRPGAA